MLSVWSPALSAPRLFSPRQQTARMGDELGGQSLWPDSAFDLSAARSLKASQTSVQNAPGAVCQLTLMGHGAVSVAAQWALFGPQLIDSYCP